MLPDIQPGNTKILYFLIVYLTGCTPLYRDRLLSAIEFFHNTEDILHGLRIKLSCLCNEFL